MNDDDGWSRVNSLLRQHGLPAVDVLYPGSRSTASVGLSEEATRVLRHVLITLMTDGDTRQKMLLQMITVNDQLKDELKAQKSVSTKYEEEIRDLQSDLNESYTRLKELEVRASSSSSSVVVERKSQDTTTRTKCLQLQRKCDTYETELDRLAMKLQDLNEKMIRKSPKKNELLEKEFKNSRTERRDGRGDDIFRPTLFPRKEDSIVDEENFDYSGSTEAETFSALRMDIKSCENSLLETKQKLKILENENEKLKLELQSRPQMKDLREAQSQIKQLQSLMQQKDKGFGKSSNKKQCSTLVQDLPDMPADVCQKYLKSFADELGIADLNSVVPRLQQMKKANDATSQLELFAREVLSLIEHSDVPLPPSYQHVSKPTLNESHQVWCERTWFHVLPTLGYWVAQLKQLKQLQVSVKNLSEKLFPWKPVKLEDGLNIQKLVELVNSLIWEEDEIIRKIDCCKIRQEESVTKATLEGIVRHFQMLFDVPHINGIYARMSEIYRKVKETQNILKHLKEFLGLDESVTSGAVVDAVSMLCETRNQDIEAHLASLFETDNIHSIVQKIEDQDKWLSVLNGIANSLMQLLKIQSLEEIVPTVARLTRAKNS